MTEGIHGPSLGVTLEKEGPFGRSPEWGSVHLHPWEFRLASVPSGNQSKPQLLKIRAENRSLWLVLQEPVAVATPSQRPPSWLGYPFGCRSLCQSPVLAPLPAALCPVLLEGGGAGVGLGVVQMGGPWGFRQSTMACVCDPGWS